MVGFVDIGDARLELGEGLVGVEISEEYGFITSLTNMSVDFEKVANQHQDFFSVTAADRVPIAAYINAANGVKEFRGFMDTQGGTIEKSTVLAPVVTINGRGVLASLVDEAEKKITRAYIDTDWSRIVADTVSQFGFSTEHVEASGVKAGEKTADGTFFISFDGQAPGEIVNTAVAATGFIANSTPDYKFIFAAKAKSKFKDYPSSLKFIYDSEESDIDQISFTDGKITEIVIKDNLFIMDPGSSFHLFCMPWAFFSGTYYVIGAKYSVIDAGPSISTFTLATELPDLKA